MKKNVKLLILSLIASLAFTSAFAACNTGSTGTSSSGDNVSNSDVSDSNDNGSDTSGDNSNDQVSDVVITLAEAEEVMQFESKQLSPMVTGAEDDDVLVWTSSNEAVATVDANGLVNALSIGTATITASIGGASASCVITVTETTYLHEIEVSLDELSMYVEKSQSVTAGVTFKGEELDGDFEYHWDLIDGENDVVAVSQEGDTATFVGLKAGTVTYVVYTEARGYEASKEITITVKETTYALGVSHEKILPSSGGYAVDLTLGSTETSVVSGISAYLVVNGEAKLDETVDVTWTTDNNNVAYADGTITATAVGTTVLTGTATYNNKQAKVIITINVAKGEVALDDTLDIETVATESIIIPDSVNKGTIQSVKLGEKDLYIAGEYGTINGNVLTVAKADLPVKEKELGKGKTLTIETDLVVYTMNVNVYTMIINNKAELDSWQEIAAQNAIDAGLCIEEQRGLVYSGYYILGNNIEYNGTWATYKNYAGAPDNGLWGLCYANQAIWKNPEDYKNGAAAQAGQLIDGAIQEDWGAGNAGGFKGTFDGNGHYIDGLKTNGKYSGFIITLGTGGIIKDIAFLNASIGAEASYVINRGNGTLENVYVDLAVVENGTAKDSLTAVIGVSGNHPTRELNNIIIDATKVDLSNWQYGYLAEISAANAFGVYILGADGLLRTKTEWNDSAASVFWHHNPENDTAEVFANSAALFADPTHGAIVQEWSGFWTVGDGYAIPQSVLDTLGGAFNIVANKTKIPGGESLTITTDKAPAYVMYALKEPVNGVKLVNNVITVEEGVAPATPFTVVATSLIDGATAEMQFSVAFPLVVLEDKVEDIEFVTTKTIQLPTSIEGTISNVTIGSLVVYDPENGIGSLNGNVITPASLPVKAEDLGKGVTMTVSTDVATYQLSVNVYTMIINNKAELDQWQQVAADNSVKAGLCIEEQKNAVLSGYFILGDNIEYNDTWTPILAYGSIWNTLDKSGSIGKTVVNKEGAIFEDWGNGIKAGFKGTFDGDNHYINGLWMGDGYSGFVITLGGGTIKNVAFTNASVGATSAVVTNRGPGTIENVYVSVVSMASGSDANNPTAIITRAHAGGNNLSNILVDVSAIDMNALNYAYVAHLGSDTTNGLYVIGAEDVMLTRGNDNAFSATDSVACVFYHYNPNTAAVADYDIAASFATTADLLADPTHGAIAKEWSGFWTVDAENGIVIPTILTTNTPAAVQKPAILPLVTDQKNLSSYQGDVTALGFAAGSAVYQAEITNAWNSRIKFVADNPKADYISVDFALAEGSTVTSFYLWPNGQKGNYLINANGVSYGGTPAADKRIIVIYDQDGNDVTKGPWVPGKAYTLRYYMVGATTTNTEVTFSTPETNNVLYFANAKTVTGGENPITYNKTGVALEKYAGDVTTLGFAEGTTVYQHTAAATDGSGIWSEMEPKTIKLIKADGMDYASVQFVLSRDYDVSVHGTYAFFAWTTKLDRTGAAGGYLKQDGSSVASTDSFDVKVFDEKGNQVTGESCLKAGTVYTMKLYGDFIEYKLNVFAADNQPMTVYYANATCGKN